MKGERSSQTGFNIFFYYWKKYSSILWIIAMKFISKKFVSIESTRKINFFKFHIGLKSNIINSHFPLGQRYQILNLQVSCSCSNFHSLKQYHLYYTVGDFCGRWTPCKFEEGNTSQYCKAMVDIHYPFSHIPTNKVRWWAHLEKIITIFFF